LEELWCHFSSIIASTYTSIYALIYASIYAWLIAFEVAEFDEHIHFNMNASDDFGNRVTMAFLALDTQPNRTNAF
jgi:hypothetical protein